jgi:hypothetical protein
MTPQERKQHIEAVDLALQDNKHQFVLDPNPDTSKLPEGYKDPARVRRGDKHIKDCNIYRFDKAYLCFPEGHGEALSITQLYLTVHRKTGAILTTLGMIKGPKDLLDRFLDGSSNGKTCACVLVVHSKKIRWLQVELDESAWSTRDKYAKDYEIGIDFATLVVSHCYTPPVLIKRPNHMSPPPDEIASN